MLLHELRAAPVALLGQLHPGGRVLEAERAGEVEVALAAPPALSPRHAAQLRVLGGQLRPDGQLVGDVLHALWGQEGYR